MLGKSTSTTTLKLNPLQSIQRLCSTECTMLSKASQPKQSSKTRVNTFSDSLLTWVLEISSSPMIRNSNSIHQHTKSLRRIYANCWSYNLWRCPLSPHHNWRNLSNPINWLNLWEGRFLIELIMSKYFYSQLNIVN